ncbi:MAG TPA: helix-hairpin-helix domain-containing protein [Pyrinomonadaceae bacterium]|nr:helix-hairpin-helix domain-containing protein [Pyrinomonadaceae bacterium]
MKLSDRFDGSGAPFEGDRTALLRGLPAGAQIRRAAAVVSPFDATRGLDPFAETITFDRASGGWGATKRRNVAAAGGPTTDNWVEVDFHRRRTLAGLRGTNLNPSTLQVDFGGAYVEINASGGVLSPPQTNAFRVTADSATLPGLTVTKLKLTAQPTSPSPAGTPDLSEVTVRSAPSNLTLRLGQGPAVWTHAGEMTRAEETPDFALALQSFLTGAEVENGFYVVPLVLHSDTIARLTVELEIDYLLQESVLPEGLTDVVLPFDFGGAPKSGAEALLVKVPANSRVAPRGVKARVAGAFQETRIVYAPTEGLAPGGAADVSPATSQAQPVTPPADLKATALDLLLNVERPARLQLDVRDDLDGKPGSASLLPAPVAFDVPGPVGQRPSPQEAQRFNWVSVPLPAELQFRGGKTHWLILQSVDGAAKWRAAPAAAAALGLQNTRDGGLSWRATAVAGVPGAAASFYRLRRKPEQFEMPVALRVGAGERAVVVSLDRFKPSGRVDFTLDIDEVSQAFNQYLDGSGADACVGSKHLANGDFERWQAVGDRFGTPAAIGAAEELDAQVIAFTPDGRTAYVGGDDVIAFADAQCDELLPERLEVSGTPRSIVFHPDGTRAYVVAGQRVLVLDTATRKALSGFASRDETVVALGVSPDGRTLFVAEEQAAWAISTVALEGEVLTGKATVQQRTQAALQLGSNQFITDMAPAPDGRRLYLLVRNSGDGPESEGEVQVYEAATLRAAAAPITVGRFPTDIALSPDGRRAVVVNDSDISVTIVNLERGAVVSTIALDDTPDRAAFLPDGRRALVTKQESLTVDVVDLERRALAQPITLPDGPPDSLAVSTQGDRVYFGVGGIRPLISVPLGVRLPVEWNLTAGRVRPVCLPAPAHLAALLGSLGQETPAAASISQVVPVAASCVYEFSFWGLATEPDATAEVFWLAGGCGLSRTDRVPIEASPQAPAPPPTTPVPLTTLALAFAAPQRPELVLHRVTLTSPPGAEQAEVRFSAPEGVAAVVDRASLTATNEAVANSDFKLVEQGQLSGWALRPAGAVGASMLAAEGALRLRNAGADEVALTQEFEVEGGQPFELEFQGGAQPPANARATSRVEVRWLAADGSQAGEPAVLKIGASGFGSSLAKGVSPDAATRGEVSLFVPPGASLEAKRVSLRFPKPSLVPLTFVSEAPGELTVTGLQVAFEQAEPKPPPIPPRGLCASTPAGMSPGDECAEEEGFCPCCGCASEMREVRPAVTPAGRPARVVRCAECGTELVRVGGPLVAGAKPVVSTRLEVRRPVIESRQRVETHHHHEVAGTPPHGPADKHSEAAPAEGLTEELTDAAPAGEVTETPPAEEVTETAPAEGTTEAAPAAEAAETSPAEEATGVARAEEGTEAAPAGERTEAAPKAAEPSLTDISGIGKVRARQLKEMGIGSVAELAAANPEDLTRLPLVSLKLAEQFVEKAKELTKGESGDS